MGAAVARISDIHKSIAHLVTLALEEWKWDAIGIDELPRLIAFCEERSAMYGQMDGTGYRDYVLQFQWRKRAEGLLEVLKQKRREK